MSSSYLNLYNNDTTLRRRGLYGQSYDYNPNGWGWGGTQNVYVAGGEANNVVHDQYNNMYYGTQKQSDLIKGLQDSIARTQAKLGQDSETRYSTGWMGALNSSNYRYTAEDRKAQNAQIESQQKYLDQINNGMYKQEASTFFDSYDDWTGDWNNVFSRRKSNADTLRRNDKITEENAVRDNKAKQQDTKVATGSVAKAKKLTPNLEINTGISAAADKLVQSLNKTGLGI